LPEGSNAEVFPGVKDTADRTFTFSPVFFKINNPQQASNRQKYLFSVGPVPKRGFVFNGQVWRKNPAVQAIIPGMASGGREEEKRSVAPHGEVWLRKIR
jgi:hypothetical protein